MGEGGSIAQWLACLLLDPGAPGAIPGIPKIISEEKIIKLLRLINGAG